LNHKTTDLKNQKAAHKTTSYQTKSQNKKLCAHCL